MFGIEVTASPQFGESRLTSQYISLQQLFEIWDGDAAILSFGLCVFWVTDEFEI